MEGKMKFKEEIKIAFSYLRRYKFLICLNIFILIFVTIYECLGIGMIIPILESINGANNENFFTDYAEFFCFLLHIKYNFANLMVIFGIVMLLKYTFLALQQRAARVLSASITYDLRKEAFQNLMELPLSYYYKTKSGDIIATLYNSSNNVGGLIENLIVMLTNVIFCVAYIIFGILISLPLIIVVFLVTLISYVLVFSRFKAGFSRGKEEKAIMDDISSFLFDKFGGIKVIKSFNNEWFHIKEFDQLVALFKRIQIKIQDNRIITNLLIEPPIFLIVVIVVIFSVKILNMSIIPLITFLFIFQLLIPKIKMINTNYLQISEYLPHYSKVQELIVRKDKRYLLKGTKPIDKFQYKIEFKNVWFRYPGVSDYVLKNINIIIEKNKTVALVGSSGGGKTTLVDLILRLLDVERGYIKIDGVDLREIKREDWHNIISIVTQEPYLFYGTIYNNILYGKRDASEDAVINAAKQANAHDFISLLHDKYGSLVGEKGIKLSGGQKQRISLARALIRNPQILILDEATSALDSESERLIHESISKLGESKTIIIIAHRLSTVANADKIIVIENSEVIEEGSHQELLRRDGTYRKYHRLQH